MNRLILRMTFVLVLGSFAVCEQKKTPTIVGDRGVRLGMQLDEIVDVHGDADGVTVFGDVASGERWNFPYPRLGMNIVVGSSGAGAVELNFGDQADPKSPMVKACKFRTEKGIGMKSSLDDL